MVQAFTAEMCVEASTGEQLYIETVARELLGLSTAEAEALFAAENSRFDLELVAVGIAERAGQVL